jgi:glycosyltransferase involved in cell wall biosynthesis
VSKPLRILHVMRAPVGGLFRHVLDLAEYQANEGHNVGIVADAKTRDALTESKFAAIAPKLVLGVHRVTMSRLPGLGDFKALQSVTRIAEAIRPDVLHGHGAKGGVYARLAARRMKSLNPHIRAFYTPHGGSLHYGPRTPAGRLIKRAEQTLLKHSDGLIFESAYAKRLFGERFGFRDVPHRVIANGLQPTDLEQRVLAADAAEFLYIGELRTLKGVDVLLDALAELHQQKPVTAIIVGSGPDGERLKAHAEQLGLAETIRFAGAMPARQAFSLGKTIVVPSRAESFPYIVLEAAGAGVPMIATNVGGIPEITAGTPVELIPPGEAESLKERLKMVRSDANALAKATEALKNNVAQKFTVAAMGSEILAFYRDCAATPAQS